MGEKPICDICGKNDHKMCVSPHSNNRKVSYLECSKFVNMSPRDRQTFLDDKGFCWQCLCSGVKKGHNPFHCNKSFVCKHPSHSTKQEGYHVLGCDKHKHTPHNLTLLHKFKNENIEKFKDDLPKFSKDINLTIPARHRGRVLSRVQKYSC